MKGAALFTLAGLCTALLPLTATAQTLGAPMSMEDYLKRVAGRTYTIAEPGIAPYGIEAYLPDQRVTWGWFESGICMDGVFFEREPGTLCYDYEDDPDLHCWQYFEDKPSGQMYAIDADDPASVIYELQQTTQSIPCVDEFLGS